MNPELRAPVRSASFRGAVSGAGSHSPSQGGPQRLIDIGVQGPGLLDAPGTAPRAQATPQPPQDVLGPPAAGPFPGGPGEQAGRTPPILAPLRTPVCWPTSGGQSRGRHHGRLSQEPPAITAHPLTSPLGSPRGRPGWAGGFRGTRSSSRLYHRGVSWSRPGPPALCAVSGLGVLTCEGDEVARAAGDPPAGEQRPRVRRFTRAADAPDPAAPQGPL